MRNHNGFHFCKVAIKSLNEMTYQNFKILIIDDGSTDNSVAKIRKEFPSCEILKTGKYLEYCRSFNLGMKYALKKGAKYMFLVNNDTKDFSKNLLEEVVAAFENDKRVGLVGPLCLDYEKNMRLSSKPRYRFGFKTDTAAEGSVVSAEAIKKVGMYNERLYRYFEDLDLIIRLRAAKYKTISIRNVSFAHLGGGTSSKQLFIPNYYRARNILLVIKKYCKDKSFQEKSKYFLEHMSTHVGTLRQYLSQLKFLKAIGVATFCTMGFVVGLALPWKDNEVDG